MDSKNLQKTIIADITDIRNERDLAHIKAFIQSLREEITTGEKHWYSIPGMERERMITAVQNPNLNDGSWVSHDDVTTKYRKWFD